MTLTTIVGVGPQFGIFLARKFALEGHDLALIARNEEKLKKYQKQLQNEFGVGVEYIAQDVLDRGEILLSIREVVKKSEVLIYNISSKEQCSLNNYRRMIGGLTNSLNRIYNVVPAFLSEMKKRKKGTIIFTGGGFAEIPNKNFAQLSLDKAVLRSYALMLAQESQESGVHVGLVSIYGKIELGGNYDPNMIASKYWELHTQKKANWEKELFIR
jgi:short-subunit dehydrogenase